MDVECYCDVNAYALKGTCECEEDCTCKCEDCDCDKELVDMWAADVSLVCACGGNCSCKEGSSGN